MIQLTKYNNEKEALAELIKKFWIAHNDYTPTAEECLEDVQAWTANGHLIYFIQNDTETIGFVHLASRGCRIDWLEDLFILPEYQGHGYGSEALHQTEEIVQSYSDSIYLEVAARNPEALKLYVRNGYNCLNTITIRKDFQPQEYVVTGTETILGHIFEVKDYAE